MQRIIGRYCETLHTLEMLCSYLFLSSCQNLLPLSARIPHSCSPIFCSPILTDNKNGKTGPSQPPGSLDRASWAVHGSWAGHQIRTPADQVSYRHQKPAKLHGNRRPAPPNYLPLAFLFIVIIMAMRSRSSNQAQVTLALQHKSWKSKHGVG